MVVRGLSTRIPSPPPLNWARLAATRVPWLSGRTWMPAWTLLVAMLPWTALSWAPNRAMPTQAFPSDPSGAAWLRSIRLWFEPESEMPKSLSSAMLSRSRLRLERNSAIATKAGESHWRRHGMTSQSRTSSCPATTVIVGARHLSARRRPLSPVGARGDTEGALEGPAERELALVACPPGDLCQADIGGVQQAGRMRQARADEVAHRR